MYRATRLREGMVHVARRGPCRPPLLRAPSSDITHEAVLDIGEARSTRGVQTGRLGNSGAMIALSYDFQFDRRFVLVDRLIGVTAHSAVVELDDHMFIAKFGRWTVATPIANLASAVVTGPYAVAKVFGPPHLSLADGGLTFATNAVEGVCISFRVPVSGLLPLGLMTHRSLTVTVRQAGALAEAINAVASAQPNCQAGGSSASAASGGAP